VDRTQFLMNTRFSTLSMLWLTAFIGISLGGILPYWGAFSNRDIEFILLFTAMAPVYVPIVFAAYALGRRRLTGLTLTAFAISQATTAGIFIWIRSM
jgi:hypothetical protein